LIANPYAKQATKATNINKNNWVNW
jgi:hypothetical protein